MSPKRYCVKLTERERQYLQKVVTSGKDKARKITRGRILLLADVPKGKTDREIADALYISLTTVFNIRRRYCQGGVKYAINADARSGQPPKFKGKTLTKMVALACSAPPKGHTRWSLRMLAERAVELGIVKSISHQSVRNILKKIKSRRT